MLANKKGPRKDRLREFFYGEAPEHFSFDGIYRRRLDYLFFVICRMRAKQLRSSVRCREFREVLRRSEAPRPGRFGFASIKNASYRWFRFFIRTRPLASQEIANLPSSSSASYLPSSLRIFLIRYTIRCCSTKPRIPAPPSPKRSKAPSRSA